MSYQAPDRSVLDAIKAAAERIEQLHFEALSPGIGLGTLKPRKKSGAVAREAMRSPRTNVEIPIDLRDEPRLGGSRSAPRQAKKGPRRLGLMRRLSAHGLDLLVISLTLVVGGKIVALVLSPPEHLTLAYFADVLTPAFYLQLGALNLLLVIYLIFGLYWVFFKIFAGLTLGESLLTPVQRSQSPTKNIEPKRSPMVGGTD